MLFFQGEFALEGAQICATDSPNLPAQVSTLLPMRSLPFPIFLSLSLSSPKNAIWTRDRLCLGTAETALSPLIKIIAQERMETALVWNFYIDCDCKDFFKDCPLLHKNIDGILLGCHLQNLYRTSECKLWKSEHNFTTLFI